MQQKAIDTVLAEYSDQLMSITDVVGVAQGQRSGKPCIRIFVIKKTPELLEKIPSAIEGYKVVIQETGEIRALN